MSKEAQTQIAAAQRFPSGEYQSAGVMNRERRRAKLEHWADKWKKTSRVGFLIFVAGAVALGVNSLRRTRLAKKAK